MASVSKDDPDEDWSEVEASAPDDVTSVSEFDENSSGSRGSGDKANPSSPQSADEGSVVQVVEAVDEGADEGAESPPSALLVRSISKTDGTQAPASERVEEFDGGHASPADRGFASQLGDRRAQSTASQKSSELEDMPLSPMPRPAAMMVGAVDVPTMSREDLPKADDVPIVESPKARNWGWGWGAMTGALKEVSAGVAKDVLELKESFQAAIRVDSDEEDQHFRAEPGTSSVTSALEGSSRSEELTLEELRTREVLDRLGQYAEETATDTELEKGLKAIDAKVENLTAGLWGLVGKAGNTVGSLAKEVASEFKETMQDVKSLHAVQLASSGIAAAAGTGKRLIENAEKGLENAMMALEEGWADEAGVKSAGPDATFDQCFYSAGGQEALEETEELGNECSRVCNRGRRGLSEERRRELDKQIAAFAPLFDTSQKMVDTLAEGGKGVLPLAQSYTCVERVRRHALDRARNLSLTAMQISERAPSGEALKGGSQDTAEDAEAAVAAGCRERLEANLRAVKGEAVLCIAAVCAAGIKHLLQLGNSVGAPLLTGAQDPAFRWPPEPSARATMLRFAVQELENDVAVVANAFRNAMGDTKDSLAVPGSTPKASDAQEQGPFAASVSAPGNPPAEPASTGPAAGGGGCLAAFVAEIDTNESCAVQRLREAFRALMYVILAMILHDNGETEPSVDSDDDDDDYIAWADDEGQGDEDDEDEDDDDGDDDDDDSGVDSDKVVGEEDGVDKAKDDDTDSACAGQ